MKAPIHIDPQTLASLQALDALRGCHGCGKPHVPNSLSDVLCRQCLRTWALESAEWLRDMLAAEAAEMHAEIRRAEALATGKPL
jgi:hypothetical protein